MLAYIQAQSARVNIIVHENHLMALQKYNTMITTYMFGDLDIDNLVQLTVDVDRVEVTM